MSIRTYSIQPIFTVYGRIEAKTEFLKNFTNMLCSIFMTFPVVVRNYSIYDYTIFLDSVII